MINISHSLKNISYNLQKIPHNLQDIPHNLKVLQAFTSSILQGGRGVNSNSKPTQPSELLKLYEMEGCPYCRRVREALSLLNLDYISYPCPKNGQKYRPEVVKLAGKAQFPFLIDPNTNTQLLESQAIIEYLFTTYGKRHNTPKSWQRLDRAVLRNVANNLATVVSLGRGLQVDKSSQQQAKPAELLTLYSFEASPFSRIVRERLCELELAHIIRNLPRDGWKDMAMMILGKYQPMTGSKRDKVKTEVMHKKIRVPFLVDANTDTKLFESKDIVAYLNQQYAA